MRAGPTEGSPGPSSLPRWQGLNVFSLNFPKIDSWRRIHSGEQLPESSQNLGKLEVGLFLLEFVQKGTRPCHPPFSLP